MTRSAGSLHHPAARRARWWATAGLVLVLGLGETQGAGAGRPPGGGAMRFEVQDKGSIESAATTLAERLGLSDEQRARVVQLMRDRAGALETAQAGAVESFRAKAEALLTAPQRAQVPWPALRWSAVTDWTDHIRDLDAEQASTLAGLLKQRRAAIWTALTGVQKTYTEGLKAMLTAAQQKNLAAMEAKDPLIRIPMR